jgi:glycosyltransferase involved in cell wall biosynthesis
MRGGEKLLEELIELYPQADIFTHVYDPAKVSEKIRNQRVYTTKIAKLPFATKLYQKYMPLMPNALMDLDLSGYDLVISSESGPAKGVVPNPDAFHVCYCHSPMRYLWDMYHDYFRVANPVVKFFMKKMIPGLRVWDVTSSRLVDHFVCNSTYVAKRIKRYYGRDADVVFGPASIEKYLDIERRPEDFYLFFGQLVGYKRVDIAIEACAKANKKLVIIGDGKYKGKVPPNVTFLGRQPDDVVKDYLSRAKALLFPGIEDLGLIPIEANAAGCPVVAYRKGGTVDTIVENETGVFFDEQSVGALVDAIERLEASYDRLQDRAAYERSVRRFSREEFRRKMSKVVEERKYQ